MWGDDSFLYEDKLELLKSLIWEYIQNNPNLKTDSNKYDMCDFKEPMDYKYN